MVDAEPARRTRASTARAPPPRRGSRRRARAARPRRRRPGPPAPRPTRPRRDRSRRAPGARGRTGIRRWPRAAPSTDEAAAARRRAARDRGRRSAPSARAIVPFDGGQILGRAAAGRAVSSTAGRLELVGEQVGGDVDHHVAEPGVQAERVGVEAVLEQANAGRSGARCRRARSSGRARRPPARRDATPADRCWSPRRAGARSRRRRPPTPSAPGATLGIQIQVGAAQPRRALAGRERRRVAAPAVRRAERVEEDAGRRVDVRLAHAAHAGSWP